MYFDLNVPIPPPASGSSSQSVSKKGKGKQQQQQGSTFSVAFSPAQITAIEARVDILVHLGYTVIAFNQTVQKKVEQKSFVNVLDPLLGQLRRRQGVVYLKRLTVVLDEDSEKGFGLTNANASLFAAYDLLALVPTTETTFSLACLTHTQPSPLTTHILSIPLTLPRLPFRMKHTLVRAAMRNGAVFEINYAGALGADDSSSGGGSGPGAKRNWWAAAKDVVRVTKGKGIILSGGGPGETELRAPKDVGNLITFLDLPQNLAHDASTTTPKSVVLRAQTRKTYRAVFSEPRVVIPGQTSEAQPGEPAPASAPTAPASQPADPPPGPPTVSITNGSTDSVGKKRLARKEMAERLRIQMDNERLQLSLLVVQVPDDYSFTMSLAKLTSLSTQTLSLLLERQRLASLPPFGAQPTATSSNNLHIPQITRNMRQLKAGILEMEASEGRSEAVVLLKSQHGRMRGMLGPDADALGIESFVEEPAPGGGQTESAESGVEGEGSSGSASLSSTPPTDLHQEWTRKESSSEPVYTPYTDDPEAGMHPSVMLQEQRRVMDDQDAHLEILSYSVNRQRDTSLQINDELGVHTGLLEELDTDLEHTHSRLTGARRQLGRVAKGTREHGSTVTIGLLILVLLILIIVFKT
ncbi:hypothetical protein EWM64_g7714 [Hericium alpestre]|uniref:t-SNARE coiled-coil homology domain-containing protein n=1 Tax=Hericium alpestre TaxID=135208 RepID=A0A4Y9ZPX7_9AGAM|nr:hypothetical protein EWM64_g7714 [Hericium alpestre]